MRCQECGLEMQKFPFCYVCPKCGGKHDPDEAFSVEDSYNVQDDPRFPDWEPDEKTQKSTILYHMSYAHENQAEKEGINWWGLNVHYWLNKFTRKQLLEIHQKYHEASKEKERGILNMGDKEDTQ